MQSITFNNEHLLIGNIGHFAVVLSVFAALFSAIAYTIAVKKPESNWNFLGRIGFYVHAVSVVLIFATLFTIIHRHYYEYQYAWQHSSNTLPAHYMISCFWEGQEGSFLLWMFWHAVIGTILIFRAKKWEAPVMAIIALAEVVLGSMLLGMQFGDLKLGSSPFILLREHQPGFLTIPILETMGGPQNYLQAVRDGNGLNPLLQNYWMVIHPPTLFFGFAATIVPFAYAFAGLWTRRYKEWLVPALPWALISVMILGTGIIMGGYWAYESLSFGGYWAWDPVENASLMPWLLIITALHLMLIQKSTGKYPVMTFVLVCLSFFMVLYATFLTRSGVLGEASVHSFTDLGLSGQLLILMFAFIALTIGASFKDTKQRNIFIAAVAVIYLFQLFVPAKGKDDAIDLRLVLNIFTTVAGLVAFGWFIYNLFKEFRPDKGDNENTRSREFWMFIGSLVLMLSGFHIILQTSIPAFNKLYELHRAVPKADYYNQWQLPFAIIISLLTGLGQFFKYKNTDTATIKKRLLVSGIIAVVLTVVSVLFFKITYPVYVLLLFAGIYAVVGNIHYIHKGLKGKIALSGASIAHVGFGLMMIGVLISSVNKQVISFNYTGTEYYSEVDRDGKPLTGEMLKKTRTENRENIYLVKDKPMRMGEYMATYKGSYEKAPDKYFVVQYTKTDPETGKVCDSFTLKPNAQTNPKMGGLISSPDTRHYLTRDIFTHVNHESGLDKDQDVPFADFRTDSVMEGQTFLSASGTRKITLRRIETYTDETNKSKIRLVAKLHIEMLSDTFNTEAGYTVDMTKAQAESDQAVCDEAGLLVSLQGIISDGESRSKSRFVFTTGERRPKRDYIIMKAIQFPYINLLWGGTVIMVFGFLLSIFHRVKEARIKMKKQTA